MKQIFTYEMVNFFQDFSSFWWMLSQRVSPIKTAPALDCIASSKEESLCFILIFLCKCINVTLGNKCLSWLISLTAMSNALCISWSCILISLSPTEVRWIRGKTRLGLTSGDMIIMIMQNEKIETCKFSLFLHDMIKKNKSKTWPKGKKEN